MEAVRKSGVNTEDDLVALVKRAIHILEKNRDEFDVLREEVFRRMKQVYGDKDKFYLNNEEVEQIITGRASR